MRMRGRRLLPIVLSLIVIIILCISYISNHLRESAAHRDDDRDEFLVHLPPSSAENDDNNSNDKIMTDSLRRLAQPSVGPRPGPLLNLTDFDYLLPNNVCRRAERELLGKSITCYTLK